MDPEQALKDAVEAFQDGNTAGAAACLRALHQWLRQGGFAPRHISANALMLLVGGAANHLMDRCDFDGPHVIL